MTTAAECCCWAAARIELLDDDTGLALSIGTWSGGGLDETALAWVVVPN